jgi:type VI protein secretion system component Hcp
MLRLNVCLTIAVAIVFVAFSQAALTGEKTQGGKTGSSMSDIQVTKTTDKSSPNLMLRVKPGSTGPTKPPTPGGTHK